MGSVRSNREKINAFGWFKLQRYNMVGAMSALDWHEQLALRRIIARALAPRLLHLAAEQVEEKQLTQAKRALTLIQRDPLGKNVALLKSTGWNLRHARRATLKTKSGIHALTYVDLALARYMLELTVRGRRREELDSYTSNPVLASSYRSWMSLPVHTGLTTGQLFGFACIDLELPDGLLLVQFEHWLETARRAWKAELRKVGTNEPLWADEFAAKGARRVNFATWTSTGLLPCMDLLITAEAVSTKLRDAQLATLLREDPMKADAVRLGVKKDALAILRGSGSAERWLRELEASASMIAARYATRSPKSER